MSNEFKYFCNHCVNHKTKELFATFKPFKWSEHIESKQHTDNLLKFCNLTDDEKNEVYKWLELGKYRLYSDSGICMATKSV